MSKDKEDQIIIELLSRVKEGITHGRVTVEVEFIIHHDLIVGGKLKFKNAEINLG